MQGSLSVGQSRTAIVRLQYSACLIMLYNGTLLALSLYLDLKGGINHLVHFENQWISFFSTNSVY